MSKYYDLNVCVPSSSHVELLNPKVLGGGSFEGFSSHKGGTLMNGISAL